MRLADKRGLLSREHFSLDSTLIQTWANHEGFRAKDGSDERPPTGGGHKADMDWKGRCDYMHESGTDPDARLFKRSEISSAILCYLGRLPKKGRSASLVGAVASHAAGFAEHAGALRLLDCVPCSRTKSVGADKAYDTADFVSDCRARIVTPHVACNGDSAIDGHIFRHAGYQMRCVIRKRIEENFGWRKTIGRIRQTANRNIERVKQRFRLTMAASNLTRICPNARCGGTSVDEPPWCGHRAASDWRARALPAQTTRPTRYAAANRKCRTLGHCFGVRDPALFNSLRGIIKDVEENHD
jgi:hypothetical protein